MPDSTPVKLELDEETGSRFLLYSTTSGVSVDLRFDGDALWMTQAEIASVFGRDVSVISRHIASILEDGELPESNLQKMQIASSDKPVSIYSLDMVISVGYRVSSAQATLFRRWATNKLVQFATKGFVIDSVRLKSPGLRDRIAELRDIIRDIRSDEANVYRELRAVCSLCQDYDASSDNWLAFYRNTQAKLIFAVASQTPSEVIRSRADAKAQNMGLRTWPHENIRKSDVCVSKNYLAEGEVRELNRLTTILLDIFEDQMDIGRLKTMAEATALLDDQLAGLGRTVLRSGGSISAVIAKLHAEAEYDEYRKIQKSLRHTESDTIIREIKATLKDLPKRR